MCHAFVWAAEVPATRQMPGGIFQELSSNCRYCEPVTLLLWPLRWLYGFFPSPHFQNGFTSRQCGIHRRMPCEVMDVRSKRWRTCAASSAPMPAAKKACQAGHALSGLGFPLKTCSAPALLGDTFQPLHHAEHNPHRHEADDEECRPALPNGHFVVHQRANPQEEVPDGRRA